MAEFRMPSLGADMEAGRLLEWLVHPGDQVNRGDIVAVVDTDKAAVEVECFEGGVVESLLVEPGERVPVGTVLATIGAGAEAAQGAAAPARAVAGGPTAAAASPYASPLVRRLASTHHIDLSSIDGTGVGGRITHADVERTAAASGGGDRRRRVSPRARRLAADLSVDLADVAGTGPGGAIEAADVRAAAESAPATTAEPARTGGEERGAAMRVAIARLMARSKREIPHYYLTTTIDLGRALEWLRERNRAVPVPQRIVPAALLLKATALAAGAVPELNGYWKEDRFVPGAAVHLGVAVALRGGGLVTPAIRDAAGLSLPELMARLRDLVTRGRGGRLRASELTDATITVTDLGDQGVESIVGVIYPPQVALVGFGTISSRPWAVGGMLGVRPVVTASLAGDHRATDGHTGARFLRKVDQLLQAPEDL